MNFFMSNGNEPLHTEVDEVLDNDSFYQQECDERDRHWWEHQDGSKQMIEQVTGILTSANVAPSNKSVACYVDGQKYTCTDFGIQSLVGNEITFESEKDEFKGNTFFKIKKWSPTGVVAPTTNVAPKTNGASPFSSVNPNLPLPFISNTVATAISAGLIKQPEDIESWVVGCHKAVLYLNKEKDISGAVKEVTDSLKSKESDEPF